jgi:hypothetical protein
MTKDEGMTRFERQTAPLRKFRGAHASRGWAMASSPSRTFPNARDLRPVANPLEDCFAQRRNQHARTRALPKHLSGTPYVRNSQIVSKVSRLTLVDPLITGSPGPGAHGLGRGVGRALGVGIPRGVGVGRIVAVGVAVGVELGVGVGVTVGVGVGVGMPVGETRT